MPGVQGDVLLESGVGPAMAALSSLEEERSGQELETSKAGRDALAEEQNVFQFVIIFDNQGIVVGSDFGRGEGNGNDKAVSGSN